MTTASLGLRTQLFGVVLVLIGAFRDLQMSTWGYPPGNPSLGSLLVVTGLLMAGIGLIGPVLVEGGG
ncbi:hypothetical protein [Halosegnis marinus]|uniref:Uncharacterized protein n=1 Tax=Halosegnis marinus TaxID=3034023 RepID=A0ABD5ZR86_9EURY|nr:hypothetical protein [Halosegnis sp. DT85]